VFRSVAWMVLSWVAAGQFFWQGSPPGSRTAVPAANACSLRGLSTSASQPLSATQLLAAYNTQAHAVRSVVAEARTRLLDKHERWVPVHVLAKRPYWARLIGYIPFGNKVLFDSTSNDRLFRLFLPRKGRFYVGPLESYSHLDPHYENVRPQHVFAATLWPEASPDADVHLAENSSGALELTIRARDHSVPGLKIEFDRSRGVVNRMSLSEDEAIVETVRYEDWEATESAKSNARLCFPRHIWVERPAENVKFELQLLHVVLNDDLPAARFRLDPPIGVPLITLDHTGAK